MKCLNAQQRFPFSPPANIKHRIVIVPTLCPQRITYNLWGSRPHMVNQAPVLSTALHWNILGIYDYGLSISETKNLGQKESFISGI